MYTKTAVLAAGLAALRPAAADFIIFIGAQNNFAGGAPAGPVQASTPQAWFFNHPPSCSDGAGVLTADGNNDLSWSGGYVCDGCKDAPPVPERMEIHDKWGTFENGGDEPHFTIYKDLNKEGNYNMVDLDNNNIGTCNIPADRQVWDCGRGPWVADSATETFRCTTKISVKGSN